MRHVAEAGIVAVNFACCLIFCKANPTLAFVLLPPVRLAPVLNTFLVVIFAMVLKPNKSEGIGGLVGWSNIGG